MDDDKKSWKHIGLYGHAVGTFSATRHGIMWKSSVMGNDDIETKRVLPRESISGALWTVFGKSGHLRVLTKAPREGEQTKLPAAMRFDGFPGTDYEAMSEALRDLFGVTLKRHSMSSAGSSWGNTDISNKHLVFRQCNLEDADEDGQEFEPRDGDEMMSLDLGEVSQCVLPGNNRNEIEMQFLESDTVEAGTDQLVALRFYVPPDADADPTDKDAPTSAEALQSRIMQIASVKKTSGSIIAEFDEGKGTFLTPRGRYSIELYDSFLRLRGAKYDYKIKYDDISRLFLLPRQDDMTVAFVIALDKPIRQGQQRYNMLVMQCTKEHSELNINLDEATLEKEYGGQIEQHMNGSFSNLVAKTFKVITRKKVFIPGKFANSNQQACVKCALRANEGHLYPLEKQFIFIHKPAVLIRFDEIESVEFQRYAGGQGSTRNFDLCVSLHSTPGDSASTKEYTFSGIDKSNYAALYSFLSGKKIKIKNLEGVGEEPKKPGAPRYDERMSDDEESDDSDFDENAPKSDDSDSDSDDDSDLGSVVSDDSDLAEHRKKSKKKKPAPKKKAEPDSDSSSDDDSDEEEERKKPSKKRKAEPSKQKKKKRDPNAPKAPKSAYVFFTSAKRSEIKEANPDAGFGDISKLLGKAYKELSDAEKEPYDEMARKDKARYKREMEDYDPPSDDSDDDADDGKAKSKKPAKKRAKKDPNAPKKPMNAFMLYSNSIRQKIKEENPDMKVGDISKECGIKYRALNEEEKKKWTAKADAAKEKYKVEFAQYEKTKPKTGDSKPKAKMSSEGKKKAKKPSPPKHESSSSDSDSSSMSDSDSDSD